MITSTANERIRAIRTLRRRKDRDERGLAYVEGIRAVLGAIEAGADIALLVVSPDQLSSERAREALTTAEAAGVERLDVTAKVFESISDRDGPQGLGAVVRQRWRSLKTVELAEGDRWIALTAVQDPGNLGTVLRTADATGAAGVILLESGADPWDRTAMRASTGAVFTQHLVRTDWASFAEWARAAGATVIGATDDAETSYRDADYGARTVLLMGSEREGLNGTQRRFCDRLVAIPMRGSVDSLNLGVAASLALYEVLHQREATADTETGAPVTEVPA
ncbi:MAG: RNA methyltransferase [Chloroflexi bacterium]|nr:RNA methyltransferase [Chloroflexota bacterium]MDA1146621.1 RNA methyltransferase [Chloroflexota bacterium]